jgi:hypothetical protein
LSFDLRTAALASIAVVAALALAACGDDDGGEEAQALDLSVSDPSARQVQLESPESVEAGTVEITLDNAGEGPHSAQLIRVEGDHDEQEVIDVFGAASEGEPLPDWFFAGGGVGTTQPGESGTATQALEPGTYYIVDDEGEEQPNLLKGGIASLEVTGEGDGELPETDAKVTASEYTFQSEAVKADEPTLFENAGAQPHHLIAVPLLEGKTIEDAERFLRTEQGPPAVDFERGVSTSVLEGGTSQVVELNLEPGRYAFVCFISDRQGGASHFDKGMIAEGTVE